MPKRTFPRREQSHAVTAGHVLDKHARETGWSWSLPVPIDLIIEQTYGLEILWEEIEEPPGATILGALAPRDRRIVMNARHDDRLFSRYVGPERFTLAHELAHWIYDVDDPRQQALDLRTAAPAFCYWRDSPGLPDSVRVREVNANKLAAHLLLPDELVRGADIDAVITDFAGVAEAWGVSRTTLRIKLETLGLLDGGDRQQLDFLDG